MRLRRYEVWHQSYLASRYLRHLSDSDLQARFADILANIVTLEENDAIGCIGVVGEGENWWVAATHVLAEAEIRRIGLPQLAEAVRGGGTAPFAWSKLPRGVRAAQGKDPHADLLVKYGKHKYLRDTYEHGRLRIAPATFYGDASLNPAVRDNELEVVFMSPGENARVLIPAHPGGRPERPVRALGNITRRFRSKTNYYVYCLSRKLSLRLFEDFDADSCLLITKPDVFVDRVLRGFEEKMPGWGGIGWGVQYVDPFRMPRSFTSPGGEMDVFLCKHFRFAYQGEYRLVWLSTQLESNLEPIDINIGGLQDCSELIVAEPA